MYENIPSLSASAEVQAVVRGELLKTFESNPESEAVWRQAYDMVLEEGDRPPAGLEDSTAADITGRDLITFAEAIRATPQTERYALTTQKAPDGQYWFDVLRTFSGHQLQRAKSLVLHNLLSQGYTFYEAVDIGTGAGASLESLETAAEHVIGLDRSGELLRLAAERKASPTDLVRADVTALPFGDASLDLASSTGLESSLDDRTIERMYRELARVLRPGGLYITSSYVPNEEGYMGREMQAICLTAKAMLADMIVDYTSGKLLVAERLDSERQSELVETLGFTEQYVLVVDEMADDGSICAVRLLFRR